MSEYDPSVVMLQIRRSRWPDEDVKKFGAQGWSRDFRWHGPPGTETHIEAWVTLKNGWGFQDLYPVSAEIRADEICQNLVIRCRAAVKAGAERRTE